MLANALDVGDEIPRRIVCEFGARRGTSASALIEQHDAVVLRIEEAPAFRIASRAGATVQKHNRLAVRIAALLVIQRMQIRHGEHAVIVGLDIGIQRAKLLGHQCLQNVSGASRAPDG